MKSKLTVFLMLFLILGNIIALSACTTPETAVEVDDTQISELESQIADLKAELEKVQSSGSASEDELSELKVKLEEAQFALDSTPTTVEVWSHFANEPMFREVIQMVFDDYMAEHPNVKIEVAWFDKNPLRESIQTVMQAGGEGAPDITTFDTYDVAWVEAGWLEPLDDILDPARFAPGGVDEARYPDLGHPEAYKFNMAFALDYLLYNKEIFDELGIQVPDDYQFTQDEFLDVVNKCNDAGYSGLANGIGNRPFMGQYISKAALLSLVGPEEFNKYWTGKQSWDTPEARQALQWVVDLGEAGLWHDSLATQTLDESHLYFHTQKKSCMFMIGSWYTSRAFKPEAEGGQSPDFHFGMLRYPEMNNATSSDTIIGMFPTGYIVLSNSDVKDTAKDILKYWSEHPEYGARWAGKSNTASAILFTNDDMPEELKDNPWQWYWDEFNAVYGEVNVTVPGTACGDFNDALTSVLNEGIPLGLMSVDEAIEYLDGKLCE